MSAMSDVHTAAQEFIKAAMEEHYGDDAMESLTLVMLDADDAMESWLTSEFGADHTDHGLVGEVFRDVAQEALVVGKVLRDDMARYGGVE